MNAVAVKSELVTDEQIETLIAEAAQVTVVPFIRKRDAAYEKSLSDEGAISAQELLSVYAVLAHIAHMQNMPQELLRHMVEAEFSIDHIAKIPQKDFQSVMTFLIDLRMDDVRSRR